MELIKRAIKVGNSAGVLLPKKLLGAEVKIIVVNRPINIKKISLKLIERFSEDILGIFLINKKPIELLAVSNRIKKIITLEKIKMSVVPLALIKKDLKLNQKLKEKIASAEAILNKNLLQELK